MKFFTFYIALSIFMLNVHCDCIDNGDDNSNDEKLIFAHVIFRHGDRTIVDSYPNDPYKNKSYWPEGFGQLTNLGKKHQYELGQYFRCRYQSLLGDADYSPDLVHIQSTDVDRTLMSAQANLAGLFPPQKQNLWDTNLHWQPIPVHTIPGRNDYILAGEKHCNKYEWAVKKFRLSNDYLDLIRNYKDLYEYLEKYSGKKMREPLDVLSLYDTLRIENWKNLTLPDWTKEVFPGDGRMQHIAERSFALPSYTPLMARLKIGFLLREIFERSRNKTVCYKPLTQKLWLYSGHDITIGNILNGLNVFNDQCPPYRSSVLFELYKLKNEYTVKIFYRNTTDENLTPLNIPNCGPNCPLNKLFEIYKDVLPEDDFYTECKIPVLSMTYEEANLNGTEIGLIGFVVFVISAIILVPIIYCNYRKRNSWSYSPL